MFRVPTNRTILLTLILIGCLWYELPCEALAQYHADFEGVSTSWKRSESDCIIRGNQWNQQRVNETEKQNRFERIEFQNGPGRYAFVAHDIPPSLIIPELTPSVRIRAPRAGAQLCVRFVLPNTPSPKGDGPMKRLIWGPIYQDAGRWQTLSFDQMDKNLAELLQQEVWLIRSRYGCEVNKEGAYIDKVAINTYSGEGTTVVELDDLKLDGWVSSQKTMGSIAIDDSAVQPASHSSDQESDKAKSLVVREGTVLLVNDQPFLPRIIQHNGEPFNYLHALGFNVLELKRTATKQQLREAQKLDLWLICPPPSTVGLKPIPFVYDRVLAWQVGDDLISQDLPVVEQRVREIRESDLRHGRPILGHAAADWSQLAKLTDIVGAGVQPIGTSFIASQYSDWINARRQAIGNSRPLWADIQTELNPALVEQVKSLTLQVPPIPLEPQQVKFLAWEGIAGGSRGFRFLSYNRLDGVDPVSRLRATTLQWVNAELEQLEPWIVGGALMGVLPSEETGNQITVTAINTNRSRLLLLQRPTHHEQYVAGDVPLETLSFRDADSPYADNAYLLGQAGLNTLTTGRSITGTEITVDDCPYSAAIVLTQDPLVVNRLTRSYDRVARQSILDLHLELTQQWLAIEQLIHDQLVQMQRSTPASTSSLTDAAIKFQNTQSMVQQGNEPTAEKYLNQTDQRLAIARREMIIEPLGMFQSKTSAPLTTHSSLIPLHWELAGRLASGQWNPNGLAGGDFEDINHLQSSGWQNWSLTSNQWATEVELSPAAAVDGRRGLRLQVAPMVGQAAAGLLEAPPLQIESPAIPVRAGQLVRIHGWVNVPNVISGSTDGLRITDSLAGSMMSERIPITNGWQEFTLYRGVPQSGNLSVRFDLTGYGEALLDEVTIRTIDIPPNRQASRNEAVQ